MQTERWGGERDKGEVTIGTIWGSCLRQSFEYLERTEIAYGDDMSAR